MAPRKKPSSLFKLCIQKNILMINSACYIIEMRYKNQLNECEREAFALKQYLMSVLPVRLFDVLCSERACCLFRGDPRILLNVLTHPDMTVFCKRDRDNCIPQHYWIDTLSDFKRLVVLDLKLICTDEILEVVGINCLLLEEINIVSRVDICKSSFNASVLIRNVSDVGLSYLKMLKRLRILAMDPPRNERASRIGRYVSQTGIIMVIWRLPNLEQLQIETCDIGSTLINTVHKIGPLGLKKINCHFATVDGIQKLIKMCPLLRELSVTRLADHIKDDMLDLISASDLRLNKFELSFFTFSFSVCVFLKNKGYYLTHFSFCELEHSLTLEALVSIGIYCHNLCSLCLMTQSKNLLIPRDYRHSEKIFSKLRTLTIGSKNFNINNILMFFLKCTNNMQKIVIKYQDKINIDEMLLDIIMKGYFNNLSCLWLDCTLEVSKNVILKLIDSCEKLQQITVDTANESGDIEAYIYQNNLDIQIGCY